MGNVLSDEKQKQVIALGRLGWTLRRIQEATGLRRETAAQYLRHAGVSVRSPGKWGRQPPVKPAKEVTTESASACLDHHEFIEAERGKGRNAMAIWQDPVDRLGMAAKISSARSMRPAGSSGGS